MVIPSSQKSRSSSATVRTGISIGVAKESALQYTPVVGSNRPRVVGEFASVELDWLIAALSLVTGAEAMVVLRDVCQLDADAASAVTDWAARVLLDATFGERPA